MSQEDSNKIKIKAKLGFNVSIDPSNKILSKADCGIGSGETVVILDVSKDQLNPSINRVHRPWTSAQRGRARPCLFLPRVCS